MAWHLYLVPLIGTGTKDDMRRPKYVADANATYVAMPYGFQPACFVAADLSNADDTALSAQSDVARIPDTLDANPSAGGVTAAQTALEALFIPAGWINTGLTWRQITRTVAGLFQYTQRLHGIGGNVRLVDGTTPLSTQFNQLPLAVRQSMIAAAESFGYDTSSLSGTSTLRTILKTLADQWGAAPIQIGGITL